MFLKVEIFLPVCMLFKSSTHRISIGIYSVASKGSQSYLAGKSKGRPLGEGRWARGQGKQVGGLTDKGAAAPQYLTAKSRAGLVMVARFSQWFRSPGKPVVMRQVEDQARKSSEQVRIRVKSQEGRRPSTGIPATKCRQRLRARAWA